MRTDFQRDRDRIVHATAFRRLTYKTQVFVFHEGDHYRTRLTHSLEVAQIARAIARMLGLDEDLAEALALAHDLGHPPFGHAGERALAAATADFGGFDHNAQSLRVVTRLERKYAGFDGLNLTYETLEGLAKHNGPLLGQGRHESVLRREIATAGLADRLHLAAVRAGRGAGGGDRRRHRLQRPRPRRRPAGRADPARGPGRRAAGGRVRGRAAASPGSRRSAPSTRSTGA